MADASRRAVFLDRDGTIVEDPGFLHQPGVLVGLDSGPVDPGIERRQQLDQATHDARLDGAYFCPHHPAFTGPCECRKPGLLLFREAQAALGLDLTRCRWVGDRLSDVEPARKLGGRALLVETGGGATYVGKARALRIPVVADLAAAAAEIVRGA